MRSVPGLHGRTHAARVRIAVTAGLVLLLFVAVLVMIISRRRARRKRGCYGIRECGGAGTGERSTVKQAELVRFRAV